MRGASHSLRSGWGPGAAGALIILAVVLVVLLGMATTPYLLERSVESKLAAKTELLSVLKRRVIRLSEASAKPDPALAIEQLHQALLPGATAGLAGAELLGLSMDLAARNNIQMKSIQAIEPSLEGSLVAVPVEMAMETSIDKLAKFLHQIETGTPILYIDYAGITLKKDNLDNAAKDADAPVLTIRLTIKGYISGGPPPS